MLITPNGNFPGSFMNSIFAKKDSEMNPTNENKETQLSDKRKDDDTDSVPIETTEVQLGEAHQQKEEKPKTFEGQLEKVHENKETQGTIEQRLNDSDGKSYPHRNPEAWERTGDKRPVNGLDEEMGNIGDEAKKKRYEKGLGKSYNAKTAKLAKKYPGINEYLNYRNASKEYKEVSNIDKEMRSVLSKAKAANRHLSETELMRITDLKKKKSEFLNII